MTTLIGSSVCPSESSSISAIEASDEGQLSVVMNDGVFILTIDASVFNGDKTAHVMKSRILHTCNKSAVHTFDAIDQCSLDEQAQLLLDHTCNPGQYFNMRGIREARWSSFGAGRNSCLLAVLSYSHDVNIFVNSSGESWDKVVNLATSWLDHLHTSSNATLSQTVPQSSANYLAFRNHCYAQAAVSVCWSSLFNKFPGDAATELSKNVYSVLAVALKDGHIALWTVSCPATEAEDFRVSSVINACDCVPTEVFIFSTADDKCCLCCGQEDGISQLYAVRLSSDSHITTSGPVVLWSEADRIAVTGFCWCEQASKLVFVKEQYIVLLHLNMSLDVPSIETSRVQLVDTKFTITGISYCSPYLFLSTVEGQLYRGSIDQCNTVCSDAVQLDLVSLPWSVSKNHGHAWMTSRSLLAMAESSSSYGCLRSSKNVAKIHWVCLLTLDELSDRLLMHNGLLSGVFDMLFCLKYMIIKDQHWTDALKRFMLSWQQNTSLSLYQLQLLRYLLQLQKLCTNPSLENDTRLVERRIMVTHVISAVKLFFTVNTDVNSTSVRECTVLSLMSALLESNAAEDIHSRAQLREIASVVSLQRENELCCVCQASIPFTDILADGCENGHVFSRCCQTLLLCQQIPYRKCLFCNSLAVTSHHKDTSVESTWLSMVQTERCTYCDGKLV